ncbi:MAG: alpha/beta hydrolase [Acidobacteria bacterium]|nr:alpha/beta hydrolase [Acidobacteriota bacterium]
MFKKIIRYLSLAALSLVVAWFLAALALVYWPEPKFTHPAGQSTDKPVISSSDGEIHWFRMRDGVRLQSRQFASESPVTLVFLHGVLSNSLEGLELCRHLHAETKAEVVALDLRGHGDSEGIRGDISYLSQYEDDVADVIAAIRQHKGGQIILAGHSMGGGIAMRYAAARKSPAVDGYLLFAPHLGSNSPTMRTEPADKLSAQFEAPIKLHLPRIIGLLMLNSCGVKFLNAKKTLFFNVPAEAPINAYSYRAMVSMAPDDYKSALTADDKPLLVIVGKNDEAFQADQFAAVVSLHPNGKTVVIEGESHDGILHSAAAATAAADWLK